MESILVIDDDPQIRKLLEEVLRDEGYKASSAESVEEGLPNYPISTLPLIVTDVLMPNREGLETIRELRKNNPSMKIIAISGGLEQGGMDVLDIAKRFGANRVLRKPFEIKDFLNVVQETLQLNLQ